MSENTENENEPESAPESGESEPVAEGPSYSNELVPVEVAEGEVEVSTDTGKVVTGPHEGDPVPYHRVVPDTSKPYSAMNCYERRAILLERMERAGHPRALGSTYQELADEFDVAKSTIHNDFQRVSEYVADSLDRDHHLITDSVFRGAILDLVEDGKKAWAAELAKEWYEWLADLGQVERMASDVNLNVREQATETDEYRVIPDDEETAHEELAAVASTGELPEGETNSNE